MDWRARLIGKALAIGALVLLLSVVYLVLIGLLAPRLDLPDARVGHTIAAILVAMLVVPLRHRVDVLVDRMLHRDWQHSPDLLRDIGAALSHTLSPEDLHALLVDDLPHRLHLQGATLWMLEPPGDHALVVVGRPREGLDTVLLANGAIARELAAAPGYLLIPSRPGHDIDWAPLLSHDVRLAMPLRRGGQLIGVYGCGLPLSGGLYRSRVISTLLMLGPPMSSAIENVRAYTKIARLNEELRALDRLKDEFIQSVGHELRTPLTSLSLAMQLLERQSGMPPALAHVSSVGVRRLHAIVERVLEYGLRLTSQADAQNVALGPVELMPLLGALVEEYAPIAEAKRMRFDLRVPAEVVALGHEPGLHRALHELIDNAVRYSEGGTVTIHARLHDGLAVVSISDEGPGIPDDERDHVFVAFYRGSTVRALAATPGAGLGLSIARRDIEAIGGQIWLERSDSSGSTLCVALPVAASEDGPPRGEERALVVGS